MAIKYPALRMALVGSLVGSLFLVSAPATAQWIFAAKHIEGRINQLTQDDQNGEASSTSAVAASILKICTQMNKKCSLGAN